MNILYLFHKSGGVGDNKAKEPEDKREWK